MVQEARTRPGGRVAWDYNGTANDSDKTILTVPVGKMVEVFGVFVDFTTTGDVGNRYLQLLITNGANTIWNTKCGAQAQSNAWYYTWVPGGVYNQGAQANGNVGGIPLPTRCILPAGYTVRVYDSAAVAAAADDMLTAIHYIEYDA